MKIYDTLEEEKKIPTTTTPLVQARIEGLHAEKPHLKTSGTTTTTTEVFPDTP